MNFTLSDEEALVQQTAREFANKELAPLAAQIDRNGEIPRSVLDKVKATAATISAALGYRETATP